MAPGKRLMVTLEAPALDDRISRLKIAECLSAAFSSGIWQATPMPIGNKSDPNSALGVIAGLEKHAVVLVASATDASHSSKRRRILGCVVGAVLDAEIIEAYELRSFGARSGDGLLAFIGIVPAVQGSRVFTYDIDHFETCIESSNTPERSSFSLARLLFTRWLGLDDLHRCPSVFIRTRRTIMPVQHLIRSNGFEYCGRLSLNFRGVRQQRIVFRRSQLFF